ncbi:polysaccharide deacetylase [Lachnospiraceae bacterium KM106-2]|nr:polysaccharide deacetylase [Lachnospiraceae bacterium KM106-2]
MKLEEQKEELATFIKVGLIVLCCFVIFGLGMTYVPTAVPASSNSSKDLPIYCVDTNEKKVSITFDAAWGNEDLPKILECLKKYDVKATFFMTGGWIEKFPDDVKAIAAAGHDMGNHSENHKHMSALSSAECVTEIMKAHDRVKQLTGKDMILFRAPYGDYNNTVVKAARSSNYHTIQWDVDSLDWKDYGVESIINKVTNHKHLGNGSIILMHNGAKYTLEALPGVIEGLQKKGYQIVPVSQLIYKDNYEMDVEGRQHKK